MGNSITRLQWVDFLKGIAIIWLMVYHFYIFDWLHSPVPVFFMLSGLFYSDSTSFRLFIKKKSKSILVPFVFFFIIGVVALYLGSVISGAHFVFPKIWRMSLLLPIGNETSNPIGVGAIWYLLSLFEMYIIYYFIRLISTSRFFVLLFGLLYFVISALFLEKYAIGSFFFLFYTGSFFIFFIIGHIYKEKILYNETPLWILIVFAVGYSMVYIDMGGCFVQNQRYDFILVSMLLFNLFM